MLSVSELTFEEVVKILEISIAIGVVHILLAFFLRLWADIKKHDKLMIYYHDIPTIVQYFAVVSLILAAIGSGYDIIGMFGITGVTHDEPVPWLTVVFGDWVTVELVAKVAPLVIIGTVITMIIGGMKEEKHLKKLGKDEGGGLVGIVVEVIMVRIIEMLSNTISYSQTRNNAIGSCRTPCNGYRFIRIVGWHSWRICCPYRRKYWYNVDRRVDSIHSNN